VSPSNYILSSIAGALEVNPFFTDVALEKNAPSEKNRVNAYRYGFNGMEKDDEVAGSGNSYTTEYRSYDPRLGRWKSIDPLFSSFPWQSPYASFDNNPIYFVDPKGLAAEGQDDGDPPKKGFESGVGSEENPIELSAVEITPDNDEPDFGNLEVERYGYNGSLKQYKEEYGYEGSPETVRSDWALQYEERFYNWVAAQDGQQQDRRNLQKLAFFTAPFVAIEDVAMVLPVAPAAVFVGRGLGSIRLSRGLRFSTSPSLSTSHAVDIIDELVVSYSKAIPNLMRAPKGGITIAGKFYQGGQFIPRPRLHFGRGGFSNYQSLPPLSTSLRPTPVNYSASPFLRWGGAIGGSSLTTWYFYHKLNDQ